LIYVARLIRHRNSEGDENARGDEDKEQEGEEVDCSEGREADGQNLDLIVVIHRVLELRTPRRSLCLISD